MTVEELERYGLEKMREEEISQFLRTQTVGILGLATGEVPYLVPLSYGYDGGGSLYFVYVLGAESRKEKLTERVDEGVFVVFSADTPFNWQSVQLVGEFESVPPSRWDDIAPALESAWRPDIFTRANTSRNVAIYEFEITQQTGFKHAGLAPGFA